jgi:squalene cyclase
MPLGAKALDPTMPYHVYEFWARGRVFYVGLTWSETRTHGRWGHVKNLVRHEDAGTLKPDKRSDLYRKSNQVIAALIRAGEPQHEVRISWRGAGSIAADQAETGRILQLVESGSVLANNAKNPRPASLEEILAYLGVR